MITDYIVEIECGTISNPECEWLAENTTDTYTVGIQDKWNAGFQNHGAQYSHSVLVIRFLSDVDAAAFKLRWA